VQSSAKRFKWGVDATVSCDEVGRLLGDNVGRLDCATVASTGPSVGASRITGGELGEMEGERVVGEAVEGLAVGRCVRVGKVGPLLGG